MVVADAGRADAGLAGERERVKDGSYPNDADAPGAWREVDDGAMETPLKPHGSNNTSGNEQVTEQVTGEVKATFFPVELL